MSRNRQIKNSHSNTQYILWDKPPAIWRANPDDPYIYVSFSLQQFQDAYLDDLAAQYYYEFHADEPAISLNLPKNIQSKFKDILIKQWIDRAKVPLKFLPPDMEGEEVRSKNVIFILGKDVESNDIQTLPLAYPATKKGEVAIPAQYKLMHFPLSHLTLPLTTEVINTLLHEAHHAIICGKHFAPYGATDKPPYNTSMTCFDSVMAYYDRCPPVLAALKELPSGAKRSDKRPEIQKKYAKVKSLYPTELGPSDIEAARVFTEKWDALNKKEAEKSKAKQKSIPARSIPEEDIRTFKKLPEELIRVPHFFAGNSTYSDCRAGHLALSAGEEVQPSSGEYAVVALAAACGIKFLSKIGASSFCLPWNRPQTVLDPELLKLQDQAGQIKEYQEKLKQAEKVGAAFMDVEILSDTRVLLSRTQELLDNAIKTRSITSAIRDTIATRVDQCNKSMGKLVTPLIEVFVEIEQVSCSSRLD